MTGVRIAFYILAFWLPFSLLLGLFLGPILRKRQPPPRDTPTNPKESS